MNSRKIQRIRILQTNKKTQQDLFTLSVVNAEEHSIYSKGKTNTNTRHLTCAWKRDRLLTVWRGISTLTRNCLCSAFSGRAKPLIILRDRKRGVKKKKEKGIH